MAAITGGDAIRNPYTSHSAEPIATIKGMNRETSFASLSLHIRTIWGRSEKVVKQAAVYPMISTLILRSMTLSPHFFDKGPEHSVNIIPARDLAAPLFGYFAKAIVCTRQPPCHYSRGVGIIPKIDSLQHGITI